MNFKTVGFYMGNMLRIAALLMIPCIAVALIFGEYDTIIPFAITIAVILIAGLLLLICKKPVEGEISASEGYFTVTVAWIILSLASALPFFISGYISNYIDAFFEVVSGFTTTGSTILTDVEALPQSLLYWRSFTHWIGGMGVLVFILAIVPLNKGNGESFHLLRAESPGPSVGKLSSTIRNSARMLYIIYLGLTVILIILLLAGGMPLFDSIVHAFGTAGTGGFSIKNASIAAYDSKYLQTVIAVGMVVFGINFNLFYLILIGKGLKALKNEELFAYLGIIVACTVVIALNILKIYGNLGEALHQSFFQVSSIITTTGYATADFNLWPELSKTLLVMLMLIGAMAGSTGGGMKVARWIILFRSIKTEIRRMLHPRTVKVIKFDDKPVDESVIRGVYAYTAAYIIIIVISVLIIAIDNFSLETNLTAVISCLNNIGPGLGMVGPVGNFSQYSWLSKIVLSLDMLFGRLEIFPILTCLSPVLHRSRH